jgi:hypothetical protein
MIGFELENRTAEELLRFVRTLGQHRYVASRLHMVHAFAIDAAAAAAPDSSDLGDAAAWAKRALGSGGAIDLASKDERLFRRATDAEVVSVLNAFWGSNPEPARKKLEARLREIDAPDLPASAADAITPFDESREEDVFPVLIDAGWELLPLAQLDFARHKGAIQAFDDFEVARFEDETRVPSVVTLHELPIFGAVELLHAFDAETNISRAPFVLWQEGNATYLDYVLRGILRASKLADLIED